MCICIILGAYALAPCFVHRVDAKAPVFREGTLFPLSSVHNGTLLKYKKYEYSILSFNMYTRVILKSEAWSMIILSALSTPANVNKAYVFLQHFQWLILYGKLFFILLFIYILYRFGHVLTLCAIFSSSHLPPARFEILLVPEEAGIAIRDGIFSPFVQRRRHLFVSFHNLLNNICVYEWNDWQLTYPVIIRRVWSVRTKWMTIITES